MSDTLQPGDKIGNYRIIEHVGQGGMGRVYRAKQLSMNRIVALKVLTLRSAQMDPMLKRRFINEARTAGKLNHENIIHVYDVAKEGETFFFSMEFVEGESVGDLLIKNRNFDAITALAIARGVLKALTAAARLGIIHRDIKPDNIIITRDGTAKLADLGLAKVTDFDKGGSITQEGIVIGTPHYMSPEQAKGLAIDCRTDIYSLGATLFHMLTGRTPFKGKSSLGIIAEVMKGNVTRPIDVEAAVPPAVSDLVLRMMAYAPEDRFATAEEVIEQLDRIEQGSTGQTVFADLPAATRKRITLAGGLILAGALLLGVVLPMILVWMHSRRAALPAAVEPAGAVPGPENGNADQPVTTTPGGTETVPVFSYIFGAVTPLADGRTQVAYDFAYASQLDDWFRDAFWQKKQARDAAVRYIKRLAEQDDPEALQELRRVTMRYLGRPEPWKIVDNALVNAHPVGVEGFVNRLTLSGDIEIEFQAEIKTGLRPSLVVSFMNDQLGNGLSFNLGRLGEDEQDLFIVSRGGRRERVEAIRLPFTLQNGVVYRVRIVKQGDTVNFWIGRDGTLPGAEPLFTTAVPGFTGGSFTLWSNSQLVKYYDVVLRGTLLALNNRGWFVRSGTWTAAENGCTAAGDAETPALLQYGGLPSGKQFRIGLIPADSRQTDVCFVLEGGSGRDAPMVTMEFGIREGRIFAGQQTGMDLLRNGLRGLKERRTPQWQETELLKDAAVPDAGITRLEVRFDSDGIGMLVNDEYWYKDIRNFTMVERIAVQAAGAARFTSIEVQR